MKIEVTAEVKRREGFTLRDRVVGGLPRYARWAARLQPLVSLALRLPGSGKLLESFTGFDRRRPLPRFTGPWHPQPSRGSGRPVVLFADTFNRWFEPGNLDAACKVLEATGHELRNAEVEGERPLCCGRTFLTSGNVEAAREEARRSLDALAPHLESGTPIVGLEPSCVYSFRDEYPALLPGDERVKRLRVMLVDEYLAAEIGGGRIAAPWKKAPAEVRVHGHCHQKAFGTFDATVSLLRTLPGSKVEPIESSCCGMAGSFGHEHYDISMDMAEISLLPAVRSAPGAAIAAAGTSCRQQIAHGTGRSAVHPIVLIAEAL
jgi:Fe-S oxidoreductase